jgi:hypothetical protein
MRGVHRKIPGHSLPKGMTAVAPAPLQPGKRKTVDKFREQHS